MNSKKYLLISILIITNFILFFIDGIFMMYIFGEKYETLAGTFTLILMILVLSALGIGTIYFIFIFGRTSLGDKYWEEYQRRKNCKDENKRISGLLDVRYIKLIPQYTGKEVFRVSSNIAYYLSIIFFPAIFVLFLIIMIISKTTDDIDFNMSVFQFIFMCGLLLYLTNINFLTKIFVSKEGIKIKSITKSITFKWSGIKTIGVSIRPNGNITQYGRIYFSKRLIKNPIAFMYFHQKKDMLNIGFKPEIIHCILKYWDGEIINLSTQKRWLKYLKKNNYI